MVFFETRNPKTYREYVEFISTGDVDFPISLSDISLIEHANRNKEHSLKFRMNVFKEDLSIQTVHIIEKSNFKDGKMIYVLLVDLEYRNGILSHYVLIDSHSFFNYIIEANQLETLFHTVKRYSA